MCGKSHFFEQVLHIIITFFLAISFIVMVAGFGALLKQKFEIPNQIGGILLCIICLMVFKSKTDGIIKVNEIAVPLLILLILLLVFYINNNIEKTEIIIENNCVKCLINAVIYASYNSIVLIPILINLRSFYNSVKKARIISLFSCGILIVLGYIILKTMTRHRENRKNRNSIIIYYK